VFSDVVRGDLRSPRTRHYITLIQCSLKAKNVNGTNFFGKHELSTLFAPHVFAVYHFDRHWTRVKDSCGLKLALRGGEISRDCLEHVLCTFHKSNKEYQRGDKTF
jgi:hypothetical protein